MQFSVAVVGREHAAALPPERGALAGQPLLQDDPRLQLSSALS